MVTSVLRETAAFIFGTTCVGADLRASSSLRAIVRKVNIVVPGNVLIWGVLFTFVGFVVTDHYLSQQHPSTRILASSHTRIFVTPAVPHLQP